MKVGQSVGNSVQSTDSSAAKRGGRSGSASEAKHSERSERAESPEKLSESTRHIDSSGAKTEISPKSREFAQAKSVASHTPDVREDRVADLKKRISEGSYRIDEDAIADRMVDEHMRGPRLS